MPEPLSPERRLADLARALPLHLLPHHLLSRLVLQATRIRNRPWKNLLIGAFRRYYGVDLSEAAAADPDAYPDFNSFFTRALRPGARPLPGDPRTICSPVDGTLSQIGAIRDGRILQAKGQSYSVHELLGGDSTRAAPFRDGAFATLYLSPRDYHRVHMPCDGRLLETVLVPGRLFGVAPHATRAIPRLYTRNERLAALFDTAAGPLAVVLVGAIFVACIETVWEGIVTPPHSRRIRLRDYRDRGISLARGRELGRFNMGSTVILLFGPRAVTWDGALTAETPLRMGGGIGRLSTPAAGNTAAPAAD